MLLAFEEQEKSSSATALSSLQPPCYYTEQSSPQIDQEDDQGDTSHGRLDELGYGSPLREQDHSEEEPQEQRPQQQQEVAVQAVREEDDDDDDDDGEQRGEKRRHQDEIEQICTNVYHSKNSGYSHDTSNEDEDPQPAKRRKFRLRRPLSLTPNEDSDSSESPRPKRHQPSPSNSDPTSKRTCKHYLQPSHKRHTIPVQTQPEQSLSILPGDQFQPKMAPNPTSTGDDESASNVSAEYQEWPMRGVFKRVIVGDEVRYGMEFSLEKPHGLTCHQYTVAHDSTNSGDSQPGDLWDIRRITGMRKVDGVEEFRVAWAQTWMPESDLGGARELVEEFKARLSVRHRKKNGQAETDVAGESPPKRRQGRPRRQL
jgi:hypothetical protein